MVIRAGAAIQHFASLVDFVSTYYNKHSLSSRLEYSFAMLYSAVEFIQAVDKQLLTYRIYPDLNHLLQPADKGLPSEYAKIETTLSPNVVKDIHNWLIQL